MGIFKSVAFDTDGVLVISDNLHFEVFNEILARHGFDKIRWEVYVNEGFISYDDEKFFEEYLRNHGHQRAGHVRPTLAQLVKEKDHRFKQRRQRENVPFFPYVQPVTKHLYDKGIPLFEVTGSTAEETTWYFREHPDVKKRFKVVISASDNYKSKPHPAPYSQGLKRLNRETKRSISPSEVVVIEDSVNGVRSAKAAGMFVIGIGNTTKPRELYKSGADLVVTELSVELFDELLSLRTRAELEKYALLERLAGLSCLSDEVNIGTAENPIFVKRAEWSFERPLETSISDHELSALLSVPA